MTAQVPAVLVVSVHDVGPATEQASRAWVDLLEHVRLPLTFLVVPGPWRGRDLSTHGAELSGWLQERQALGDEVSLHGWCHRADVPGRWPRRAVGKLVARGAAEFWALDRRRAAERTSQGLVALGAQGLEAVGMTPPGWLISGHAMRGLADCGLRYVTHHTGLVNLDTGDVWPAPALCNRPAAAGAGRSLGEASGRWVLGQAWRWVRSGRSVRIGLHPDDLLRPGLAAGTVHAIERCLEVGAVPLTYRDVARRPAAPRSRRR